MKLIILGYWLFLVEVSDLIADFVFGKEKSKFIQFGCDPESDNYPRGFSHIYNKNSGLIDVIDNGKVIAYYGFDKAS